MLKRLITLSSAGFALLTLSTVGFAAEAQETSPGACGPFTIAVIPDTQFYADYTHQRAAGFPFDAEDLFLEQTQYIADHAKSAGGDIVFATALGDVWQHTAYLSGSGPAVKIPDPKTTTIEVPNAVRAYRLIQGKLPFSVVPGNHDYDIHFPPAVRGEGDQPVAGLGNFRSVFSADSEFFKGMPWYVDSFDGGADSVQMFTAGNCRFLHIGLQYLENVTEGEVRWASNVLRRFPGVPTIITTHGYLERYGDHVEVAGRRSDRIQAWPSQRVLNDAERIWNQFISQHDQIFMVLSGHRGGASAYSVARNRFGNEVHQVLSDFQTRWQVAKDAGLGERKMGDGIGDGWLRLMMFDLHGNNPSVHVRTYSTHYKKFSTDIREKYLSWYKKDDFSIFKRAQQVPEDSDEDFLKRDDFVIPLPDYHRRFDAVEGSKALQ